jgi:hypothetical protein
MPRLVWYSVHPTRLPLSSHHSSLWRSSYGAVYFYTTFTSLSLQVWGIGYRVYGVRVNKGAVPNPMSEPKPEAKTLNPHRVLAPPPCHT